MNEFISLAIIFAGVTLPFVATPFLWRRMKRVRDQSYRSLHPRPHKPSWEDAASKEDGVILGHSSSINDDLMDLGNGARQSRWPIDNQ